MSCLLPTLRTRHCTYMSDFSSAVLQCVLGTLTAGLVTCCPIFKIIQSQILKWSLTSLSTSNKSILNSPFTSRMQTQQIRNATRSITHTQSLTVVKTLLQAGLGAITYLRFFQPSVSCCIDQLIISSKKFTTGGQFFFTFIFLSHIS